MTAIKGLDMRICTFLHILMFLLPSSQQMLDRNMEELWRISIGTIEVDCGVVGVEGRNAQRN